MNDILEIIVINYSLPIIEHLNQCGWRVQWQCVVFLTLEWVIYERTVENISSQCDQILFI
jgi:hypothetical protein